MKKNSFNKFFIFCLVNVMFYSTAFAAGGGGSSSSGTGFSGLVSLSGGIGTAKNKDSSIPKVDTVFAELALQAGYRIRMVTPLLQVSYTKLGQTTDADTVSGYNMGGAGYLFGAGLDFSFSRYNFTAVYDFGGEFSLDKKSASDGLVVYGKPTGFHVFLGYNLMSPRWRLLLNFSQLKYEQQKDGSTTVDIKDNPVTYTNYGLGVGYRF